MLEIVSRSLILRHTVISDKKMFPLIIGESVEENANLVIRLLIRRPECLGPALRGEGEGLLSAVVSANAMSEQIARIVESGEWCTDKLAVSIFEHG